MNYYPHHIGDFNNATRHLTRVERSLYRDLIELYYDKEQPLQATDLDALCKKVLATSDDEKRAVGQILSEFFVRDGDVWRHERCDEEIANYKAKIEAASKAGKASAQSRSNKRSTSVKRPSNVRATNQNQEPVTNNQKEKTLASPDKSGSPADPVNGNAIAYVPLVDGSEFGVSKEFVAELEQAYPRVDGPQTLKEIRVWCIANPANRKTRKGAPRFINRWFERVQNGR